MFAKSETHTMTSILVLQKFSSEERRIVDQVGRLPDYEIFMAIADKVGWDSGQPVFVRTPEGEEVLVKNTRTVSGRNAKGEVTETRRGGRGTHRGRPSSRDFRTLPRLALSGRTPGLDEWLKMPYCSLSMAPHMSSTFRSVHVGSTKMTAGWMRQLILLVLFSLLTPLGMPLREALIRSLCGTIWHPVRESGAQQL